MSKIYVNGKMMPEAGAAVSVFDRSFLYGEGAFETMRTYKGRPAFCDMHYHRLKSSCEKLKIELPLDEYAFEHAVVKTINVNKLKEAFVRVTISPVGLSMGIERPPKLSTNVVIIAKQFKGRLASVYAGGVSLVMVESVFADDPLMAEIKSTNYLTKMMARMEVSEKRADEGLFVNRKGLVLEATAANLFIVKNECAVTPPLTDGCLPGITRWVVMGLASELGVPMEEASIRPADLGDAEEIFITSSTSEVLPVREVRGITKKKNTPGPVTVRLMKAYRELVSDILP